MSSCNCRSRENFQANNAPKENFAPRVRENFHAYAAAPAHHAGHQGGYAGGACAGYSGPCNAAVPRAPQPCCHQSSHECACTEYGLGYHTLA